MQREIVSNENCMDALRISKNIPDSSLYIPRVSRSVARPLEIFMQALHRDDDIYETAAYSPGRDVVVANERQEQSGRQQDSEESSREKGTLAPCDMVPLPASPLPPDLDGALERIRLAARVMSEIQTKWLPPQDIAMVRDVVARLEARLHQCEQEKTILSLKLYQAEHEVDYYRLRCERAEEDLEALSRTIDQIFLPGEPA